MKNNLQPPKRIKITLISLTLLLLFISGIMNAQEISYNDNWGGHGYNLEKQNKSEVEITFSVSEFSFNDINIKGEAMKQIELPGNFLPNDEGAPDLPGMGRYIAVPQGAKATYEIVASKTEIFKNINIAPAPRIPKVTDKGPLEFNKNEKIYSRNAFYPESPVILSDLTRIRGVDAVILGITPYQYNPVTKELVVYRDIKVKVNFEGGNGQFGDNQLRNRWFEPLLSDVLINYNSLEKIDFNTETGTRDVYYDYLIICPDDPDFIAWADSLKKFRNLQGIKTEVFTITDVGGNTTSAIEAFIDEAYNDWNIVAVLLLADYGSTGNTIISPDYSGGYGSCISDNIYADQTGNDLPDIIFARMTAENETDLETMVTKVINYETDPPTNPDFYDHPITALGWQTERWFQICSEAVGGYFKNVHGKDPVRINEIYGGNPSVDPWSSATNTNLVLDYFGPDGLGYIPATPQELGGWSGGNATMINNTINDGSFLIQHRDHGYEQGWGEPDYSNSSIDGLTNTDLIFVFSINCLTGKFNWYNECFTEKFHRYTYNGENSGALGLIAATEVSYSFVNDTYVWGMFDNMWPDFMPDMQTDTVVNNTRPRGLLPAFGNAGGKWFLDYSNWPWNTGSKAITYYLFHHHGCAFSTLYSEVPQNLTVIHDNVLLTGLDYFTVQADEGSFIALSVDGEIIGTANGTGEPVDIPITPQFPPAIMDVVVTKTNFYRYHEQVEVIPASGPYIIEEDHFINDAAGNGNGTVDYGETILLTLAMENVGSEDGEDINVYVSSEDEYVTITDSSEFYGNVPAGEIVTIDDGFEFEVAGNIPDQHTILFNANATNGTDTWKSSFTVPAYAPMLEYVAFTIDDSEGNGNGRLDPGETANIIIEASNSGSQDALEVVGELNCVDPIITINSGSQDFGDILSGASGQATFSVTASPTTPVGYNVIFDILLSGYAGIEGIGQFDIFVGQIPALVIDLDGNMNSGPYMYQAIQNLGFTADYVTAIPEDIDIYSSIFVCLGVYNSNHILSTAEGEILADFLVNGGRLYMEGGDTWYYDSPTAVHAYFKINGTDDGSSDLSNIAGQPGTFTEGMNYSYSGDNDWIDHIAPLGSAFTIFKNTSPTYNNAVAYDGGIYRTIGASFEFGGLSDSENTKLELMEKYLEFFGFTGPPDAPICPAGPAEVCQSADNTKYSTSSVENADLYVWMVEPEDAGFVIGNDTLITVEWSDTYLGMAEISVCAMNSSGLGPESDVLEVTVHEKPTAVISGDTEICAGDSAQLTVDLTGTPPWSIVIQGGAQSFDITSSPFNFWAKPSETTEYAISSVMDDNDCINTGEGSALVTIKPLPGVPEIPNGITVVDNYLTPSTEYSVVPTPGAIDHIWELSPPSAGTLEMDNTSCTINWVEDFVGIAELTVRGVNDCGEGEFSESLNISLESTFGIEETEAGVGVVIYPNPTEGQCTIELTSQKVNEVNIKMLNAIGFAVFEAKNIRFNQTYSGTIDLSAEAEGMYFLVIESEAGVYYKKIIINR